MSSRFPSVRNAVGDHSYGWRRRTIPLLHFSRSVNDKMRPNSWKSKRPPAARLHGSNLDPLHRVKQLTTHECLWTEEAFEGGQRSCTDQSYKNMFGRHHEWEFA